jgi:2-polyprenyl-3-methyl-5-hydroxy-6-metoxy-1,4-benzoquinol methylase
MIAGLIDFDRIESEEGPQAVRIAEYFAKVRGGLSVLDVGCGPGVYVQRMLDVGIAAWGVDNDERLVESEFLERCDLLKYRRIPFDIVLSLEVGEHLWESQSKSYVKTLAEHASCLIYFSAAQPGQGGVGHYNCQPKAYWIERFAECGWALDQRLTDAWLGFMIRGPHMGWLVNNGMVFSR